MIMHLRIILVICVFSLFFETLASTDGDVAVAKRSLFNDLVNLMTKGKLENIAKDLENLKQKTIETMKSKLISNESDVFGNYPANYSDSSSKIENDNGTDVMVNRTVYKKTTNDSFTGAFIEKKTSQGQTSLHGKFIFGGQNRPLLKSLSKSLLDKFTKANDVAQSNANSGNTTNISIGHNSTATSEP